MSNRAFVIDDVDRWRGGEVPLTVDGALVIKRPPVDLLLGHHVLEFTRFMGPGIHTDQGEWLVFQIRDERPLVWPGGPSGESELAPEIKQHDFAAIVAQSKLPAVLVFAFDVWGLLANAKVTDVVQFRFGLFAYGAGAKLHVGIFF